MRQDAAVKVWPYNRHPPPCVYNAAEQLFGDRGYEKVTMAEIAAQAGMSKKTLYVHFADHVLPETSSKIVPPGHRRRHWRIDHVVATLFAGDSSKN
ncbi:hypothetical protein ECAE60S_02744 [Eoetvoesiella caeni]